MFVLFLQYSLRNTQQYFLGVPPDLKSGSLEIST